MKLAPVSELEADEAAFVAANPDCSVYGDAAFPNFGEDDVKVAQELYRDLVKRILATTEHSGLPPFSRAYKHPNGNVSVVIGYPSPNTLKGGTGASSLRP